MATTQPENRPGFEAFLEYMQAKGIGFREPSTASERHPSDDLAERIVAALGHDESTRDIPSLLSATQFPSLDRLLQALDGLLEHGLITRELRAEGETIALSRAGERAAAGISLARAAGVPGR